jgi:hypothetical protein
MKLKGRVIRVSKFASQFANAKGEFNQRIGIEIELPNGSFETVYCSISQVTNPDGSDKFRKGNTVYIEQQERTFGITKWTDKDGTEHVFGASAVAADSTLQGKTSTVVANIEKDEAIIAENADKVAGLAEGIRHMSDTDLERFSKLGLRL